MLSTVRTYPALTEPGPLESQERTVDSCVLEKFRLEKSLSYLRAVGEGFLHEIGLSCGLFQMRRLKEKKKDVGNRYFLVDRKRPDS